MWGETPKCGIGTPKCGAGTRKWVSPPPLTPLSPQGEQLEAERAAVMGQRLLSAPHLWGPPEVGGDPEMWGSPEPRP